MKTFQGTSLGTKLFKVQMSFSAASKGFKRLQAMNKGLIKDPSSHDSKKDSFELESHKRSSQNRARRAFELIKLKLFILFF